MQDVIASGNDEGLASLVEQCCRICPEEPFFPAVARVFNKTASTEPGDVGRGPLLSGAMAAVGKRISVELWKQKEYEHAVRMFSELIDTSPQSATLWMNLAVNYRALGRQADAVRAAQRAKAIDPFNAYVREMESTFHDFVVDSQSKDTRVSSE